MLNVHLRLVYVTRIFLEINKVDEYTETGIKMTRDGSLTVPSNTPITVFDQNLVVMWTLRIHVGDILYICGIKSVWKSLNYYVKIDVN